jgi:hypothetical protein
MSRSRPGGGCLWFGLASDLAGTDPLVADIEVLLTAVIGWAFALIREILDGRHGPNAEQAFARHVLASLGVPPDEADAIVTKAARAPR